MSADDSLDATDDPSDEATDADVAVVGAGPAGCVLSYLLARSGVDTVLLERHGDLDREFRGYLFQPRVLDLFDRMGVLDDVLALPHEEVRRPEIEVFGRSLSPFSFEGLPVTHDFALLMEQPALLRYFVDRAAERENFAYLDRTPVEDLLIEDGSGAGDATAAGALAEDEVEDGSVVGVRVRDRRANEERDLRTRLVVGADGRYSTVRSAADVDPGLFDSDAELLWFKLPASAATSAAQARVDAAGFLLYFGLGGGEAQAGLFVEKGTHPELQERGIESFYDRVLAIDPSLDGALQSSVADFGDCSLLRIAPGMSERWADDGLLLIGDAAHVASPIGGQGNSLAIQDAVVAHPRIVDAVRAGGGTVSAPRLRPFESRRRREVGEVLRAQRRLERALTAYLRHGDRIPASVRRVALRAFVRHAPAIPGFDRTRTLFALGPDEFEVATDRFVSASRS